MMLRIWVVCLCVGALIATGQCLIDVENKGEELDMVKKVEAPVTHAVGKSFEPQNRTDFKEAKEAKKTLNTEAVRLRFEPSEHSTAVPPEEREENKVQTDEEARSAKDELTNDGGELEGRGRRGAWGKRRHAATVEATAYRVAGLGRPLEGWKRRDARDGSPAVDAGELRTVLEKMHSEKNRLMDKEKEEEEEEEEEDEDNDDDDDDDDEEQEEEEEEEEEDEEEEEEEDGTEPPTVTLPGACQISNGQINCSGQGLNHLPIITDLEVATLDLSENNISNITMGGLSGLPNLETLDLSKNQLEDNSLSPQLFVNLTRLKRLFLNGNQLTYLPPLPSSLEELKINDNRLSRLTPHSFKGLFHLLSLELEENDLHDDNVSPLTFKPLRRILYLKLNNNHFRSLPLGLPRSLQELQVQENQIEEVTEEALKKSVRLRVLDLSHNLLHEHGMAAGTWIPLTKLEALDLSHNRLYSVPLFLPKQLRQLTLQHNAIDRIPAHVFRHLHPGLDFLSLSHNALGDEGVQAVSFLGLYKSLAELRLDNNRLEVVPRCICRFKSLEVLRLDYNQIRSVPRWAVCHSRVVRESPLVSLHLENNLIKVEKISPSAFSCLRDPYSVVLEPQPGHQGGE